MSSISVESEVLVDLISELDEGPNDTTILQRALHSFNSSNHDNYLPLVAFGKDLLYLAGQVDQLLQEHESASPTLKTAAREMSVASWIYSSNKIEFAGAATLQDTVALVQGYSVDETAQVKQEVMLTYNLLSCSYPKEPIMSVRQLVFDTMKIQKWHQMLYTPTDHTTSDHFMPFRPGHFRQSGCFADNLNGTQHFFPHHKFVKELINSLTATTFWIARHIDEKKQKNEYESNAAYILDVFGLAAFVQFHFVDTHPFQDGNGRMCRFLSKRILDSILPFPFPMFSNRTAYLKALEGGRQVDSMKSPFDLQKLLLEEAVAHYGLFQFQSTADPSKPVAGAIEIAS